MVQVLDTTRLALLQLPNRENVMPDMVLICSLLLKSLKRQDSPRKSLSSTLSQVCLSLPPGLGMHLIPALRQLQLQSTLVCLGQTKRSPACTFQIMRQVHPVSGLLTHVMHHGSGQLLRPRHWTQCSSMAVVAVGADARLPCTGGEGQ